MRSCLCICLVISWSSYDISKWRCLCDCCGMSVSAWDLICCNGFCFGGGNICDSIDRSCHNFWSNMLWRDWRNSNCVSLCGGEGNSTVCFGDGLWHYNGYIGFVILSSGSWFHRNCIFDRSAFHFLCFGYSLILRNFIGYSIGSNSSLSTRSCDNMICLKTVRFKCCYLCCICFWNSTTTWNNCYDFWNQCSCLMVGCGYFFGYIICLFVCDRC